jgi:hypothetical protein
MNDLNPNYYLENPRLYLVKLDSPCPEYPGHDP